MQFKCRNILTAAGMRLECSRNVPIGPRMSPDVIKNTAESHIQEYTGWPRKNATTLIVNFKDIINKTELVFILLCGKFIFQQNDTMIINFG